MPHLSGQFFVFKLKLSSRGKLKEATVNIELNKFISLEMVNRRKATPTLQFYLFKKIQHSFSPRIHVLLLWTEICQKHFVFTEGYIKRCFRKLNVSLIDR